MVMTPPATPQKYALPALSSPTKVEAVSGINERMSVGGVAGVPTLIVAPLTAPATKLNDDSAPEPPLLTSATKSTALSLHTPTLLGMAELAEPEINSTVAPIAGPHVCTAFPLPSRLTAVPAPMFVLAGSVTEEPPMSDSSSAAGKTYAVRASWSSV